MGLALEGSLLGGFATMGLALEGFVPGIFFGFEMGLGLVKEVGLGLEMEMGLDLVFFWFQICNGLIGVGLRVTGLSCIKLAG